MSASFIPLLKNFDLYRRVPKDLRGKRTVSGALVSLVCLAIVAALIGFETYRFTSIKTETQMVVDAPRTLEKLSINLNVTVPNVPCFMLALDTEDALGGGVEDFQGRALVKTPVLGGTGCNVAGHFAVSKAPGNFHLSTHGRNVRPEDIDMAHDVAALFFTDAADADELDSDLGLFRPLDGLSRANGVRKLGVASSYEYYLQVVPTVLVSVDGEVMHTYQFTYNVNDVPTRMGNTPTTYFKYSISPVTVRITQSRNALVPFLLQLCAIVGGVYTVSGLIAQLTAVVVRRLTASSRNSVFNLD